jgi:hypothetical protein
MAIATLVPAPLNYLGLVGFYIIVGLIIWTVSRYESSTPNEWLLLIEDGKLIKGGIGLKAYKSLTAAVVKFKSTINKVEFSVSNVTKENLGVDLKGFCMWEVYD